MIMTAPFEIKLHFGSRSSGYRIRPRLPAFLLSIVGLYDPNVHASLPFSFVSGVALTEG